jgi:hypothetical protein
MRAFRAEASAQMDELIGRALRAEPYPTSAQRADAWEALRARAAVQSMLPALDTAPTPWHVRLRARLSVVGSVLWSSRAVLLEEAAYRRARRDEYAHALRHTPYVQFQPMW